jgi:hypothetical protein
MTTSLDGAEWTMPVILAEQGGGYPLAGAYLSCFVVTYVLIV